MASKLTALENLHSELFCSGLNLKLIMILETSKIILIYNKPVDLLVLARIAEVLLGQHW